MMMETDYGFVNSNELQTVGNVLFAHDTNYFKSFLHNLNALRINKQLCDVEIECHGETLLAHKGLRKSLKINKKFSGFGRLNRLFPGALQFWHAGCPTEAT